MLSRSFATSIAAAVGLTLAAAAARAAPMARVFGVEGGGTVKQGSTYTPARPLLCLYPGDEVMAASGGKIIVRYEDGRAYQVSDRGALTVGKFNGHAANASLTDDGARAQHGQVARVVGVEGGGAVKQSSKRYSMVQNGMALHTGERLVAKQGGSLTVRYADGCTYKVEKNEVLELGDGDACRLGGLLACTAAALTDDGCDRDSRDQGRDVQRGDAVDHHAVARITNIEVGGLVNQGSDYVVATVDMALRKGDRLVAKERGSVTVKYESGCTYRVTDKEILTVRDDGVCGAGVDAMFACSSSPHKVAGVGGAAGGLAGGAAASATAAGTGAASGAGMGVMSAVGLGAASTSALATIAVAGAVIGSATAATAASGTNTTTANLQPTVIPSQLSP